MGCKCSALFVTASGTDKTAEDRQTESMRCSVVWGSTAEQPLPHAAARSSVCTAACAACRQASLLCQEMDTVVLPAHWACLGNSATSIVFLHQHCIRGGVLATLWQMMHCCCTISISVLLQAVMRLPVSADAM
jgi:hypothetical protein